MCATIDRAVVIALLRFGGLLAATVSGGCATMFSTGDNKDYPVQVYSGTQAFMAGGPARQNEPEFRTAEFEDYVLGTAVALFTDTIVLPITIPLTAINVFTPPSNRANWAIARY